jgi:enoyl-CoA hydratase/carnithine racemase
MSYVLYEKTDHIVTITLNRPERMNAMGEELFAQLVEADKNFAADGLCLPHGHGVDGLGMGI